MVKSEFSKVVFLCSTLKGGMHITNHPMNRTILMHKVSEKILKIDTTFALIIVSNCWLLINNQDNDTFLENHSAIYINTLVIKILVFISKNQISEI